MHQNINLHQFREAFRTMGRATQFSYDGLEILFDHFEEMEDSLGHSIELDVIAICCDYSEETPEAIAGSYSIEIDGLEEDDIADQVREYLIQSGAYIGTTDLGLIVYHDF
jgi:hypothetical protein